MTYKLREHRRGDLKIVRKFGQHLQSEPAKNHSPPHNLNRRLSICVSWLNGVHCTHWNIEMSDNLISCLINWQDKLIIQEGESFLLFNVWDSRSKGEYSGSATDIPHQNSVKFTVIGESGRSISTPSFMVVRWRWWQKIGNVRTI